VLRINHPGMGQRHFGQRLQKIAEIAAEHRAQNTVRRQLG